MFSANISSEVYSESSLPFNSSLLSLLSDSQKEQLFNITSPLGKRCLINWWLFSNSELPQGLYCNATWDNIYCWPPSLAGTVVTRYCSEAFEESHPVEARALEGNATRTCLENGTWSQGIRTNYDECANSFEDNQQKMKEAAELLANVQLILFIGSILSLICLGVALTIFFRFRCLMCDRVTIQINLMAALILRFILLVAITEPFLFARKSSYRDVNWICKAIICTFLYATVTSVSWMFVFGLHLNTSVTTAMQANAMSRCRATVYYLIGWGLPGMLVLVYAIVMVLKPEQAWCWKGYAGMNEIWILMGPLLLALVLNLCFMLNIVRVVCQKVRRSRSQSETSQVLATVKATLVLFFVLGVNNLLMVYNPGDEYEKLYIIANSVLGATQGIVVAFLYCFMNKEVQEALRRSVNRMVANWNLSRRQQ